MHASAAPPPLHGTWGRLDAVVLEEIDALRRAPPPLRPPATGFASDEDFLVRSLHYLAGHADPAALVARLAAGFAPAPVPEAEPEPAGAPDEGTEASGASAEGEARP